MKPQYLFIRGFCNAGTRSTLHSMDKRQRTDFRKNGSNVRADQRTEILVEGSYSNYLGCHRKTCSRKRTDSRKDKAAIHAGVKFSACKACAEQLGTTEKLLEMGVEVKYWGEGLTEILKENEKLITI